MFTIRLRDGLQKQLSASYHVLELANVRPPARKRHMFNEGDQSTMSLDDSDIVMRILAGDAALYQVLVRRYNRRLYHVAWSILQNEHEAEDVMQEAYVRAYKNLSQFGGRAQFATWLTKIAIHEALGRRKHLRKEREMAVGSTWCENRSASCNVLEQSSLNAEARRALEAAINALPEEQRTIFVMHYVDEISIGDIAECLQVRKGVVKMRLFRARCLLRQTLCELAGVTSPTAFLFLGERCDRVSDYVRIRIARLHNLQRREMQDQPESAPRR